MSRLSNGFPCFSSQFTSLASCLLLVSSLAVLGCDTADPEEEVAVNPVAEFTGLWADSGLARTIEITEDGQACLTRLDWYWTDCFGCLDACSIQADYEPGCGSVVCGDLAIEAPDSLSEEFGDVVFTLDMSSSSTGYDLVEGRFLAQGRYDDGPEIILFWSILSSPCADLELEGHYAGMQWYPDDEPCPPPED